MCALSLIDLLIHVWSHAHLYAQKFSSGLHHGEQAAEPIEGLHRRPLGHGRARVRHHRHREGPLAGLAATIASMGFQFVSFKKALNEFKKYAS